MGMTHCVECGKDMSDKAVNCPGCGAPVAPLKNKKKGSKLKIALMVLVGIIAIGALAGRDGKNSADAPQPSETSAAKKDPCANIKTMADWDNASKLWQLSNSECKPSNKKQGGEVLDILPASYLWKEFNANEVAANKKYKGATVAIEGKIYSIESSIMGYPEIVFNISHGIQTVRCQFAKQHSDTIAEMKKGQQVIVIGTVGAFVLGSALSLDDCYFGERMK